MTTASFATAADAANVWVDGRLLSRRAWQLRHDRVLPRVGDLAVSLYRTALEDRVSLLEVVLTVDSGDHLETAPCPNWIIDGTEDSRIAVYFVDVRSDELRYWLDMLLGLGYTWSLATPQAAEGVDRIDSRGLDDALRNPAVCITEHDGEILQVGVRDEAAAGRVLRGFHHVACELGYEVTEGP